MATTSSLFLYSLTLQPPSSITKAIIGSFTGKGKGQEILTASGSNLSLYSVSYKGGLSLLISHNTFGIVRTLAAFRLPGNSKDYIIVGSDSGRITILEYDPESNVFEPLALETFGKSGIRRVVPGEYLAVDPKGRGCMIASVEKNKLVYILNRTAQVALTISSPLEAHKAQAIVFALVALDNEFENPTFAALEVDYSDAEQDDSEGAAVRIEKELVYYELDLGLNHVIRKPGTPVDRTANFLVQVPGGKDGPSGVLVCGEESITYVHDNQEAHKVPIPRRRGATEDPFRKRRIVAGTMHKMPTQAFCLLQTEDGDLLKACIDLSTDEDGNLTGLVDQLRVSYFDTIATATVLLISKAGLLFAASEGGSHQLYAFENVDNDDQVQYSSKDYTSEPGAEYEPIYFYPRTNTNLAYHSSLSNTSPTLACKVAVHPDDDVPQIHTVSGTGARSAFTTMRSGLAASELVGSTLPENASGVWTVRLTAADEIDTYLVIAYEASTMVLELGDNTSEAENTGLMLDSKTIDVCLFGEDNILQVVPKGMLLVKTASPKSSPELDWNCPPHTSIVAAACNHRQAALGLSNGEIVYFESSGNGIIEYNIRKEMEGGITCLSIGEPPEGSQRSRYLAVGSNDMTVRIVDLNPDASLETLAIRGLTSAPHSLCILQMSDSSSGGYTLYLHVGLQSGVYLRTVLDEHTGDLGDSTTRFLGTRPVRLSAVTLAKQYTILAMSSRSWLGYSEPQTRRFMLKPLDFTPFSFASSFCSAQFPQAAVGTSGRSLRVFGVENLTKDIIHERIPLAYTPRALVQHPERLMFYTIGSDYNTLSIESRTALRNDPKLVNGDAAELPAETFGYPRGQQYWASAVQAIDPVTSKKVTSSIELEANEAATSATIVQFTSSQDDAYYLIVGTGKDMKTLPRSFSCGYIHAYRIQDDGKTLHFEHKTKVAEPPLAVAAFQGRVLVGIGKTLTLYDLGMKQCLRKAAATVVPNMIVGIQAYASRIAVSDLNESVSLVTWRAAQNALLSFADDTVSRWTTCAHFMDYDSVAGGDKFGNLWLVRSPGVASEEADEEGAATHLSHERAYLGGAPNRLELQAHFFPGDIPTSLQKCQLVSGGRDVLVWSGLQGTIGVLIPFVKREDVDFFQSLEKKMREVDAPLAGRDHLFYRGYYAPVKGIIDGDLCERFARLKRDQKAQIAAELERDIADVERKIGDLRIRSAF